MLKNPLCSICGKEYATDPETSLYFCADCEAKYGQGSEYWNAHLWDEDEDDSWDNHWYDNDDNWQQESDC